MNFATAFYFSILNKTSFKRKTHHFVIAYIFETGELQTGYNNEIYYPTIEDIQAQDWEVL